ncbi:MAG: NAD(P)-dependent alcohol dehydrogenase [Betaproteobacteria bacterium]|nr:NAD(P)-dependent alcohol dehydrogenase [Betaproteobacteria bacterium]
MKRYEVFPGHAGSPLQMAEFEPAALGDRQVAVAIKAVSLNYRDILVTQNTYFCPITDGLVPCSDGAGEVVAVGKDVRGLMVGDRVASLFFPNWQSGRADGNSFAGALGAEGGGVLTERFIAEESGLIKLPDSISYSEAATLSCAALTAWHSLFEAGDLKPGQTVLLLGTGGVSIYALQFAKAAGATVIITSSDDGKLAHAKQLGADHGINYRTHPEWQEEVRRMTNGRGVDVVLEVGGPGTLERSLASVCTGGRIAYIGVLTGLAGQANPVALIPTMASINGIFVGSRAMFTHMLQAIEKHGIRPVIDREFPFDQAPAALELMRSGGHFGKIVIKVAE